MFGQIAEFVSRFIEVEKEEFEVFRNFLIHKQINKNDFLLQGGQICNHIYFINKGCLRYFYLVDGKEKTAQFFFENEWYTDYKSLISGDPSESFVQAMEDTELLCIERNNLQILYKQVPKFERFGRLMAEFAFLGISHRTKILTHLSAEERYLNLIKERPKIFERVPQQYIASYLNIQPQSLSRIRKRLFTRYRA